MPYATDQRIAHGKRPVLPKEFSAAILKSDYGPRKRFFDDRHPDNLAPVCNFFAPRRRVTGFDTPLCELSHTRSEEKCPVRGRGLVHRQAVERFPIGIRCFERIVWIFVEPGASAIWPGPGDLPDGRGSQNSVKSVPEKYFAFTEIRNGVGFCHPASTGGAQRDRHEARGGTAVDASAPQDEGRGCGR